MRRHHGSALEQAIDVELEQFEYLLKSEAARQAISRILG